MPAKDGTNRGGARPGAGRKKKSLAERIEEGKPAMVMSIPDTVSRSEMPEIKDYLKAEQRMGDLYAADIYKEVWEWLCERGCERIVSPQLIEQYAMNAGRWVQIENLVSEYGLVIKNQHGVMASSPLVTAAHDYMKQANQIWYQIFSLVKENCSEKFTGSPQDTLMERLLDHS